MTDTSWLGAAIDVRSLLAEQQAAFIDLLRRLDTDEWAWPTSPPMLIKLLSTVKDEIVQFWQTVDLDALGGPVRWAGPEAHPLWLDVARDYTCRKPPSPAWSSGPLAGRIIPTGPSARPNARSLSSNDTGVVEIVTQSLYVERGQFCCGHHHNMRPCALCLVQREKGSLGQYRWNLVVRPYRLPVYQVAALGGLGSRNLGLLFLPWVSGVS